MIPAVVIALLIAVPIEAAMLLWLDRRAALREAEWWEDLRAQALAGYDRVFDQDRDR